MYIESLGYDVNLRSHPYRGAFKNVAKKLGISTPALRESYVKKNPERMELVHQEIENNMKKLTTQFPDIYAIVV
jgi:hypothetical protein